MENLLVQKVEAVAIANPKDVGGSLPDTKVEKHLEEIVRSFKSKPTSVKEALTLLEHIALKHIEPLIDRLRDWALSEVPTDERKLAENAIKEAEKTA